MIWRHHGQETLLVFTTNVTGFTPNLALKPDEQERCRNLHICTRAGGRSRLNHDLTNGPRIIVSEETRTSFSFFPFSRQLNFSKPLRNSDHIQRSLQNGQLKELHWGPGHGPTVAILTYSSETCILLVTRLGVVLPSFFDVGQFMDLLLTDISLNLTDTKGLSYCLYL